MLVDYTVEIMAGPVLDDDWSPYEQLLDLFPGTVLIQDPIEPSLIFSVQAGQDYCAHAYISIIMDLVGITYTKICVSLAERVDFDYAEEDYLPQHA